MFPNQPKKPVPSADTHDINRHESHLASSKLRSIHGNHPTLYKPTIHRYMCTGVYSASSSGAEDATCNGFKTQIKVIEQWRDNTRVGALRRFTSQNDDGISFDLNEVDNGSFDSVDSIGHQPESIVLSDALIFKDKDSVSENSKKIISDTNAMKEMLPEEEYIKEHSWTCWGRTEVDYLVLKNLQTGKEKFVAALPNTPHASWRTVKLTDKRMINILTISSIKAIFQTTVNDETDSPTTTSTGTRTTVTTLSSSEFAQKLLEHMKRNTQLFYDGSVYNSGVKVFNQVPTTAYNTLTFMKNMVIKAVKKIWSDNDRWNS